MLEGFAALFTLKLCVWRGRGRSLGRVKGFRVVLVEMLIFVPLTSMLCFHAELQRKNNSHLKMIKENKGEYKRQEIEWVSARLSCVSFSRRGVSAAC